LSINRIFKLSALVRPPNLCPCKKNNINKICLHEVEEMQYLKSVCVWAQVGGDAMTD